MPMVSSLKKVHWSVGLLVIALLTSVGTFLSLSQTPFANGWDSYFYLIQIKSWIEEGAMHSADRSLIYPLFVVIYKVVGSYITSFKVVASLLTGLLAFLTGFTVKRWSKSNVLALLFATLLLWSPHLSFVAAQYPKNILGLCFFLLLLAFGSTKQWWMLILLIMLNFFGHRMTAVLSIIYVITLYITRFKYAKELGITVGVITLLFLLSTFIPGVLSPLDMERFQGILSPTLQYPFTAFVDNFGPNRIDPLWKGELFLFTTLFFILLLTLPFLKDRKNKKREIALIISLCILVAPIYRWSIDGAALRFYLIFILLAPLTTLILYRESWQRKVVISSFVLVPTLILMKFFAPQGYSQKQHDPDYRKYAVLTERALQAVPKENIELIIGHKSLAEYFTFTTGVDVLPWEVEYEVAPEKLWRIATDIEKQTLYYYTNAEEHHLIHRLSPNYFLLPDHLWKKVLAGAEKEGDEELLERVKSWRNPHRIRPAYLLKGKKS